MSPEEPGLYESRWSLVTERGAHFGDTIWCIIPVEEGGTLGWLRINLVIFTPAGNATNKLST